MSDEDKSQKTEQPTPKRLDEARKKGNVARSPELAAAAVTLAAGGTMVLFGGSFGAQLGAMMADGLSITRAELADPLGGIGIFRDLMLWSLMATAPVLAVTFLVALVAPMSLGGWNFSAEALTPKLERISPLAGFKRMFSIRSLVELCKSVAKFALVAIAAIIVLWSQAATLEGLASESVRGGIGHALQITGVALLIMTMALVLIAVVDVPYQLWSHKRELKMSLEEVRRELRESEGAPEIRARVQSIQQQMAQRRMMQDVPTATVVITNPQHYAVALRYDEARSRAPIVVAKGADEVAAKIRELATEHRVPLVEAPPLARVLFRAVDIGTEIPSALYMAVAQILSYVIQLRTAVQSGVEPPEKPVVDPEIEQLDRQRLS